jgi:hypothetical protein
MTELSLCTLQATMLGLTVTRSGDKVWWTRAPYKKEKKNPRRRTLRHVEQTDRASRRLPGFCHTRWVVGNVEQDLCADSVEAPAVENRHEDRGIGPARKRSSLSVSALLVGLSPMLDRPHGHLR